MSRVYYNENDPFCAEWLYNLIQRNLIAPGDIDTRDIRDVKPNDLRGYAQHHFFAGIGGWSLALRLAGVGDHEEVWTGSCPCQPFSAAGKRGGFADERHLWPSFHHLIAQCRPAVVFGEQVASAAAWLRLVRSDLEAMEYAVGAMPIEAASAGADHLRDRYWFVAESNVGHGSNGLRERDAGGFPAPQAGERGADGPQHGNRIVRPEYAGQSGGGFVGHDTRLGWREGRPEHGVWNGSGPSITGPSGELLADAHDARSQGRPSLPECPDQRIAWPHGMADCTQFAERESSDAIDAIAIGREARTVPGGPSFAWVIGADGKARRVKPGIRLLAHGIPGRVGKLRGFGNAIDPRPAAAFISAWYGNPLNPEDG